MEFNCLLAKFPHRLIFNPSFYQTVSAYTHKIQGCLTLDVDQLKKKLRLSNLSSHDIQQRISSKTDALIMSEDPEECGHIFEFQNQ